MIILVPTRLKGRIRTIKIKHLQFKSYDNLARVDREDHLFNKTIQLLIQQCLFQLQSLATTKVFLYFHVSILFQDGREKKEGGVVY